MPSQEELIKKVEELFEAGKFQEIVDLLSDEVLEREKSADLYHYRGRSWQKKYELDLANTDFTKAIELRNDFVEAYNNRGITWAKKTNFDEAISDYTNAITIKQDYAIAYYNRAISLEQKKEYDLAIADYTRAIQLNGTDAHAYNNRGATWATKKEYDNAILDYNMALSISKNYANAYFNRGIAWRNKKEFNNALEDYTKAIELNKNDSYAYNNRGYVFEIMNQNENAIADYKKALELDPSNVKARDNLDNLLAKLGLPQSPSNSESFDNTFYKIRECTDELSESERINILKIFTNLLKPIIEDIRKSAENIDIIWKDVPKDSVRQIAHYTSLKVADLLVMDKSKHLRYSNAVFMNDPDEGKILIDCIDNRDSSGKIKKAFNEVLEEESSNFYLGSFLPVTAGHEDELLMWRTYGRDELYNEAAGCCLLIDLDFFDKYEERMGSIAMSNEDGSTESIKHPLYRVLYYNQRQKKFTDDDAEKLNDDIERLTIALQELLEEKRNDNSEEGIKHDKAIDKVLYHTLSELRYFFKSSDYQYESELRVIQFKSKGPEIKIDNDASALPRKLFIDSSKEVKSHIKKIILGPKVPHPQRWLYLKKKMELDKHDLEMKFSDCHFQ